MQIKEVRMGVLYEHWRTDLNECFYVGASWTNEDDRPYEMKDRGSDHVKIQNEIKDNGASIEVRLIECSHLSDDELDELETLQIAYWKDLIGDRLVNKAKGGRVGWGFAWSAEMRNEQSRTMAEFYKTPKGLETIEKIRQKSMEQARAFGEFEKRSKQKNEFYSTDDGISCKYKISSSLIAFYETNEGKELSKKTGIKVSESLKKSDKFWQRVQKQKELYLTDKGKEKIQQFTELMSRINKGSGNPNSNLDEDKAQQILDFVGSHAAAAREFGVTYATAYFIRKRTSWKHLTPSSQKSEII